MAHATHRDGAGARARVIARAMHSRVQEKCQESIRRIS